MKIQELRIGNLVYLVYPDGITHKVEITGILPDKVFFKGKSSGFSMYEAISPIPLTEEILLKCGFSDKDYKQGYIGIDYKSGAMTFDFVLNKPGFMGNWNKCYTFILPDYRFVNIDYLHQLQNLYFDLTGEELEVKL